MIKKIVSYIIFFSILIIVYIISNIIYSREIYLKRIVFHYFVVTSIVFFVNLYGKRSIKWTVILLISINFLVITIFAFNGTGHYLAKSYTVISSLNIPFLPMLDFPFGTAIIRLILYYFGYFIGTLLYWYLVYYLSKKITNFTVHEQK
ncbi:MAG: hypothetical protein FWF54_09540 [Candidatus Azobacteroides sp.]|nr:hypothetical protein [Candidatus Azobacteroides sp.]